MPESSGSMREHLKGLCPGRVVYFYDGMCKSESDAALKPNAATVADVLDWDEGRVNLSRILSTGDVMPWPDVPFHPTPKPGCWSWMPRV